VPVFILNALIVMEKGEHHANPQRDTGQNHAAMIQPPRIGG